MMPVSVTCSTNPLNSLVTLSGTHILDDKIYCSDIYTEFKAAGGNQTLSSPRLRPVSAAIREILLRPMVNRYGKINIQTLKREAKTSEIERVFVNKRTDYVYPCNLG